MTQETERMPVVPVFGEIIHPEIAGLEKPLTNIASQIKDSGVTYDLIVCDDTSGRIPALALRKILAFLSEDQKNPDLVFISKPTGLERFDCIVNNFSAKSRKVLIATEYSAHGNTVMKLHKTLRKRDYEAIDIAIVGCMIDEESFKWVFSPDTVIYIGMNKLPWGIWNNEKITGLNRYTFKPNKDAGHQIARNDVNNLAMRVLANLQQFPA